MNIRMVKMNELECAFGVYFLDMGMFTISLRKKSEKNTSSVNSSVQKI